VPNGAADHPVEKNPRGGGGEECHNPIPNTSREFPLLNKINEVTPMNRVESLPYVELKEESLDLVLVKSRGKVFDIKKVVVNALLFDESTLGIGNKFIHERSQPVGKHLGNNLSDVVNQDNGFIRGDLLDALFLSQQGNICGIEPMKILHMKIPK
jgi:hypothetical protein